MCVSVCEMHTHACTYRWVEGGQRQTVCMHREVRGQLLRLCSGSTRIKLRSPGLAVSASTH